MNIFALVVSLLRREPMLVVPYVVYSLLTFLLTTYFVPVASVVTMATVFQLPLLLLVFLILGDFLARGITITLIAMQFSTPERRPWRQWWLHYSILSIGFGLLYIGVSVVAMRGHGHLAAIGVFGAIAAMLAVFLSVILILFAPFLMFFRGIAAWTSIVATFGVIRYRLNVVFRVLLMNVAIVFLFVFLGAAVSQLPLIGVTLGYLFQALGQMTALVYSFIVIGSSEWKSGVLLADDGPPPTPEGEA